MTLPTIWHGIHEIPEGSSLEAVIGPLSLSLSRHPGEWLIGSLHDEALKNRECELRIVASSSDLDPAFQLQRFLTRSPEHRILLRPLLADRPVVARPELPILIPADDEADIFISTPVWIDFELPDEGRRFVQVPTLRMTDTWFGPDTRHGVVAYAVRTAARANIDNLPRRPYRAITTVRIRNQSSDVLALDRFSVPTPNLTLYTDLHGNLWTNSIEVVRERENVPERVDFHANPPKEAEEAVLITPPRENAERSVLSRALRVLIR